jgi:hypothetical protein
MINMIRLLVAEKLLLLILSILPASHERDEIALFCKNYAMRRMKEAQHE